MDRVLGQRVGTAAGSGGGEGGPRLEEVAYIRERKIYDIVPLSECWQHTGKKPIAGMWVDVNKGDLERMALRSRYVAKEFKR